MVSNVRYLYQLVSTILEHWFCWGEMHFPGTAKEFTGCGELLPLTSVLFLSCFLSARKQCLPLIFSLIQFWFESLEMRCSYCASAESQS